MSRFDTKRKDVTPGLLPPRPLDDGHAPERKSGDFRYTAGDAVARPEGRGMDVIEAEARPSQRGPAEWFTGIVWIDEIAVCSPPSRLRFNRVTFEPGARTHWHTHPVGQVIHVLSGIGRAQTAGGPVRELRPGDTVVFAPGERHWHGAAPDRLFVHLAAQEAEDGSSVTWFEPVSDAEYR